MEDNSKLTLFLIASYSQERKAHRRSHGIDLVLASRQLCSRPNTYLGIMGI